MLVPVRIIFAPDAANFPPMLVHVSAETGSRFLFPAAVRNGEKLLPTLHEEKT